MDERDKLIFDEWKEVQNNIRQFNDVLLRIRNLAFVFAGAVIAGVATLYSATKEPTLVGYALLAAQVPWFSLYILDRFYYHVLLVGATQISSVIEDSNLKLFPVTEAIRIFNREQPIPFTAVKTGRAKVSLFYGMPSILAISLALYLILQSLWAIAASLIVVALAVIFEVKGNSARMIHAEKELQDLAKKYRSYP